MRRALREAIDARITKRGGHWIWTGIHGPLPRVHDSVTGRKLSVRRLLFGRVPPGTNIRNECGEPSCVRPEHQVAYRGSDPRKTAYNRRNYAKHREAILAQQKGYRDSLRSSSATS